MTLNNQGGLSTDFDTKVSQGVELIRQGLVVLVNTDTVPGIAISPTIPEAVDQVYCIKGRDWNKPLVWMVADFRTLADTVEVSPEAESFIENYWPGALTLIFKVKSSARYSSGVLGDSLAIRIPSGDRFLTALLKRWGEPLAVTSVNRSGQGELTRLQAIRDQFSDVLDFSFYNDQDEFEEENEGKVGLPSTVVDVRGKPRVIRQGGIAIPDDLRNR